MKNYVKLLIYILLTSCMFTSLGFINTLELKEINNSTKCNLISTILFYKNSKNRAFINSKDYIFYTRVFADVNKGLYFYGITPILPIPLVYVPWLHFKQVKFQKNELVFAITILNKNQNNKNKNLTLNKDNFYLVDKNKNNKIYPAYFEEFETRKTANDTYRKHNRIVCNNISFDIDQIESSNSIIVVFDNIENYKENKNYYFILEKDGNILINTSIKYKKFDVYFDYFYE